MVMRPGLNSLWCGHRTVERIRARFVTAGLDAALTDEARPLICIDEQPKQLVSETRVPLPPQPGIPARYDYEYKREGVANLFMLFQPLLGWRYVWPTERRTAKDFAEVLRWWPRSCTP